MPSNLIYDVGMNDGTDTAYYLHKGFNVVGIEASPVAAAELRRRFAEEIKRGSLVLLNVGVAEEAGEFPFWVCDDQPQWSSFHREIASRNGCRHHKEMVKAENFATILTEQGVPYYCKIDIEGNDRCCIEAMTPSTAPPFISIEMAHDSGDESLQLLSELGYNRFKIISQSTWSQPTRLLWQIAFKLGRLGLRALFRFEKIRRGYGRLGGWRFPRGSSGPFGKDTQGRWHELDETLSTWRFLRDIDERNNMRGIGDWYDIHACRHEEA
jgi:FkbM family methyltransferase